jgi:hypothetical protein
MSANAHVLGTSEVLQSPTRETAAPHLAVAHEKNGWNPADFEREQILGLIRRVFFAGGESPVTHVVFSSTDPEFDVTGICVQVARVLAVETSRDVAMIEKTFIREGRTLNHFRAAGTIKANSIQMTSNLWQVPSDAAYYTESGTGARIDWPYFLARLRTEFAYTVIQGPPASRSSDAAFLAQLADGIILVLGAHTRRATARNIKAVLQGAQSRILGTVLSQRTFPIPERLYRRL